MKSSFVGNKIDFCNMDFPLYKLLLVVHFVGASLMSYTYIVAYWGFFDNTLFWISIILMYSSLFIYILINPVRIWNITILLLVGFELSILRLLPCIGYFHFPDELFHYQTTMLILECGSLNFVPSFEISIYFPGLELLSSSLIHLTGLNIIVGSKLLIIILHMFMIPIVYLFLSNISSSKSIGTVGAYLYSLNPLYVFFHSLFSYESLGIFYFLFILFIVSLISVKHPGGLYYALLTICLISVSITHHFSSIMIVFIIGLMGFVYLLMIKLNLKQNMLYNVILLPIAGTVVFGYLVFVSYVSINYLFKNFSARFLKIFDLAFLGGEKLNLFSTTLGNSLLPIYEYYIDTFIYAPLVLILCCAGTYLIFKYNDYKNNFFVVALIIFGPVLYMLSLLLIPTSGAELAQRLWGFLYIGIVFVLAVVYSKLLYLIKSNVPKFRIFSFLLFISFILLLVGGISIGDKPIHREPSLLKPKLVSSSGAFTPDLYSSAAWFENNFNRDNIMVGDRGTAIVFNTYASQNVERWSSWKLFLPSENDERALNYLESYNVQFIILDARMGDTLAELGYYFDKSDNYKDIFPIYGAKITLPYESINKFDHYWAYQEIYNNENIILYCVDFV